MRHIYKKLFSCMLILLQLDGFTQSKPTIYVGGGLNSPIGTAKQDAFLNNSAAFNLGAYLPLFSKSASSFGLNLSGDYLTSPSTNFKQAPNPFTISGATNSAVAFSNPSDFNQTITQFGIGPQFNFTLGKKLMVSPLVNVGLTQIKRDSISFVQEFVYEQRNQSKEIYSQTSISESGFYASPGLKLSYPISNKLGLWVSTNYSFSKTSYTERTLFPLKNAATDEYSYADVIEGSYEEQSKSDNISSVLTNFGLSYSFGKSPDKKPKNNLKPNSLNPIKKPSNKPSSVVFNNPSKKENKTPRKLIPLDPKNNSNFEDGKSIKQFSWKLIGEGIPQPNYIIEVKQFGTNRRQLRSYSGTTKDTKIKPTAIFKESQIASGQYEWKVTETSTGTSSTPSYFSVSNCQIDFNIDSAKIECLGYEGEDRKFKISFESTYSSVSGDLTYAIPGSGLTVYDQTYSALSYTLVSPNPTLLTQVGATTTTVNYSFEVTASPSVTSIGFGLQGDDLDPSPILCQPGVSLVLDELPDCYCKECDDMVLNFDDFTITPNGASDNLYNINGSINVNVPIYAMEFQVQSYAFSAIPAACTAGVSQIEQSGMITMPGTTINGSSSLQLYNESASGSPSSNDNITKIIKYSSDSPLTGPVPINLNIGLPGPLAGLDSSCCAISYTVCIKVKVYYDQANCKSCVFTHCFEFTNQ